MVVLGSVSARALEQQYTDPLGPGAQKGWLVSGEGRRVGGALPVVPLRWKGLGHGYWGGCPREPGSLGVQVHSEATCLTLGEWTQLGMQSGTHRDRMRGTVPRVCRGCAGWLVPPVGEKAEPEMSPQVRERGSGQQAVLVSRPQ